ncbi:MAG: hypothetical protein KAT43_04305 [Nanoarchaeota archaeon]|nr:hypothetical protein [Nanoarchaeota archaeon]
MKRKYFDHCIKENELIETGIIDKSMAKELLALAEHKEQFWKEINKADKYPSMYIEGYYEIIKELCTTILTLDGWKALNHECLFAYIRNNKQDLELDFDYLLELKDTRNAIDYRGVRVSAELWKKNKLKIEIITKTLKDYIKKQL